MMQTGRELSPEFKRGVVAVLEGSGRVQVAAGLGIQPSWLPELAGGPERARLPAGAGPTGPVGPSQPPQPGTRR